jgi:type IV pilus assembly protein PilB
LDQFEFTEDQLSRARFMRGKGCNYCQHTGFRGRVAAYEMMLMNSVLREMTFRSEPTQNMRRQARLFGMKTLVEDAGEKALAGVTTLTEAYHLKTGAA